MDWLIFYLKAAYSFAVGIMFWFLMFLVMMAYAFMPGKELRSGVVLLLAPILYLIGTNYLFNKLFKPTERKERILNFVILLVMTVISLAFLDLLYRLTI